MNVQVSMECAIRMSLITDVMRISPTWMQQNGVRLRGFMSTFGIDSTDENDIDKWYNNSYGSLSRRYIITDILTLIGTVTVLVHNCKNSGIKLSNFKCLNMKHGVTLACRIACSEIKRKRRVYILQDDVGMGMRHPSDLLEFITVVSSRDFLSVLSGKGVYVEWNATIIVTASERQDILQIMSILKQVTEDSSYYTRHRIKIIFLGNIRCRNYSHGYSFLNVLLDDDCVEHIIDDRYSRHDNMMKRMTRLVFDGNEASAEIRCIMSCLDSVIDGNDTRKVEDIHGTRITHMKGIRNYNGNKFRTVECKVDARVVIDYLIHDKYLSTLTSVCIICDTDDKTVSDPFS